MFFCAFGKISKNIIFWQHFPMRLILKFICEFWEVFQNTFYRTPLRNCLFHVQVAVFQPTDTVKNYFTGAFQALYTRTREVAIRRRSFTQNPWRLSVKRLISNEVARCQPVSLRKKVSHIFPSCILPLFSKNASRLLLPKEALNCASKSFFRKYKQKVVLHLPNSNKSTVTVKKP